MKGKYGPRPQDTIDRANYLLDNFSDILQKRGIKVDRPSPIDFNQKIATPDWSIETMFGCVPPRTCATLGNEMLRLLCLSIKMVWVFMLSTTIAKLFWPRSRNEMEAAPKPRLTDKSYRSNYLEEITLDQRYTWVADKKFVTTEEEPLLLPMY